MPRFDWSAEIGGAPALLKCVPGLNEKTLWAWQKRGHITPRGQGTGHRAKWTAVETLEIATRVELSRLGVLPEHAQLVWHHVQDGMIHQHTLPDEEYMPAISAILCADPVTGRIVVRVFDEAAEEDAPNGSHLNQQGAPLVVVVFRISRFVQTIAARIRQVRTERMEGGR